MSLYGMGPAVCLRWRSGRPSWRPFVSRVPWSREGEAPSATRSGSTEWDLGRFSSRSHESRDGPPTVTVQHIDRHVLVARRERAAMSVARALVERVELGEREGVVTRSQRVTVRAGVERRRSRDAFPESRWACLLLLLAACSESHQPADAGSERDGSVSLDAELDAADPADAGADSPSDCGVPRPCGCADADGDGHAAAACGGDDCDDERGDLSPSRGSCDGPTGRMRCEGTGVVTDACPPEAPHCDARTGDCVGALAACGDGVVHDGEECDDGNDASEDGCNADCRLEPCLRNADCPEHRPSCSERRADGHTYCRADGAGLPMGSRCAENSECASGWCHAEMRRCTVRCLDDGDCEGANHWCTSRARYDTEDELFCAYGCFRPSDCDEESTCTRAIHDDGYLVSRCRYVTGTLPVGADCWLGRECVTNLCRPGDGCTTFCVTDADCTDARLPSCTDLFVDTADRPSHWTHRREMICLVDRE